MAPVKALVLEAATYVGSVALIDGARLLGERTVAMRGREHEALMPAVADLLRDCGLEPAALGRVVCGAGPGSFTSLRIAGGIAKGLAMSAGVPLVPVSSLALVVASQEPFVAGRYLAAIDALRGEHYVALYEVGPANAVQALSPTWLVPSATVQAVAAEHGARAVGPGQGDHSIDPHARAAARLAGLIDAATPADLAGWEPAYGRLAEAQVKWEAAHGRPLAAS
ncbi:MAG: tRNA (adenosine(37)-N6)-threonylcarbamoyltransferase complex dimerization subunit type 1 TsaB [Gemmatimonadaceae bacterium]|nr:tRNA (adenosine(37)-N6)-threonylcarbamoyltransferase complex dimerization subunit type 1 TsaB [Gemmatimonadaceae bacterium]